jgi:hypothetical protein
MSGNDPIWPNDNPRAIPSNYHIQYLIFTTNQLLINTLSQTISFGPFTIGDEVLIRSAKQSDIIDDFVPFVNTIHPQK